MTGCQLIKPSPVGPSNFFSPSAGHQQTMACVTCDLLFFFVLLTRSKWHEEVPDGGHHLAHFSLPSQIPLELSFWQFFKSYPVVTRNDQPMSGWVVAGAVGKSCVHAHTRTRTRSLGFTNGFLSFPEFFFSILVRYVEDSQVLWI